MGRQSNQHSLSTHREGNRKVSGRSTQCLQPELQNQSKENHNSGCLSQSKRLRCPPYDAGNRRSGWKSEMHPKQHGEVHLLLCGNLRFIDSFQFLLSRFESLVSSNKPEDFEIIQKVEPDPEKRALVLPKGVYPYEYMKSFERFNETSLPPKEAFYSSLTKSSISDEDYKHTKKVWEAYECEWETTTIFILQRTRFSLRTCFKTFARRA